MQPVDLVFKLRGDTVPVQNSYGLYAALCTQLDAHLPDGVGIFPIRSQRMTPETVHLDHTSVLRIRTTPENLSGLLKCSNKSIDVGGSKIRIGVPEVYPVEPGPLLYSRVVTIKDCLTEPQILMMARTQLDQLGLNSANVYVPRTLGGFARRRTVPIKGTKIVGYSLVVDGLDDDQSNILLSKGLGGRRRMGCGLFFAPKNANTKSSSIPKEVR